MGCASRQRLHYALSRSLFELTLSLRDKDVSIATNVLSTHSEVDAVSIQVSGVCGGEGSSTDRPTERRTRVG